MDTSWYVLSVRGIVVSTVVETHTIPQYESYVINQTSSFWQDMCDLILWMRTGVTDKYPADELHKVLAVTLTAGSVLKESDAQLWKSFYLACLGKCSANESLSIEHHERLSIDLDKMILPETRQLFVTALALRTRARAAFRTTDQRIGLAKLKLRPGDKLCILFGSKKPIILRPCADGWQFIGVAYVHDIMNVSMHESSYMRSFEC